MNNLIAFTGRKESGKTTCCKLINLIEYFNNTPQVTKEAESIQMQIDTSFGYPYIIKYPTDIIDFLEYHVFDPAPHTKWQIKSFAEPIKKIICILTGSNLLELSRETFKNKTSAIKIRLPEDEYYPTYRELMQIIGTDLFRKQFYPDIWVDILFRNFDYDTKWLIDDCRFINEYKAIKDHGGIVVKVQKVDKLINSSLKIKYKDPKDMLKALDDIQDYGDEHVSEKEQREITPDYYIVYESGDIRSLVEQVHNLYNLL